MSITLTALQKQRRDTAANWTSVNPTLLTGEIGIESDTNKWKVGTGSAAWTALAYMPGSQLSAYPIVNVDIAAGAEIAVSKLADGTARQLLQTDAAGTGVEWASNIDVPGTLDVTGAATFDSTVAVTGALTKSGSNVVTVGDTGTVTSTMILDGTILNADINASAAIVDTKLATIATGGKVSNSATTATNANTASAIVARDASGNFTAGTITASLTGNASTVTTNANLTGDVTSVGNATSIATGVVVNADINASAAIAFSKLANVSATDRLLGRSTAGAGAIEEVICTAAGRALIDDADAAAQRTTLGLVIGTNVQAYDANTAKTDVAQTFTAGQRGEVTTLTDAATIAVNFADSNNFVVTLGGSRTLGNPTNQVAGQSGSLFVVQDGTGSRTLAYSSDWEFAGGTAPTLSTAASAVDRIDYIVRASTSIHAVLTKAFS